MGIINAVKHENNIQVMKGRNENDKKVIVSFIIIFMSLVILGAHIH